MTRIAINGLLTFKPYYKSVLWGGDRIAALKGDNADCQLLGESWELSAVPGHESVVDRGPFKGRKITDLANEYGVDLLGADVVDKFGSEFPLLIKLIDARQNLSVQVHPDDRLAMERHGTRGKTEMWYVMDSDPGAEIYSGLCAPLSPDSYADRVAGGTIMDVVAAHESKPGQFYFIPAGTIHAIGAGNLIAEVQETSDVTYRVYDYDRRDADGNPRQLHTAEARDAIDYTFPRDIEPTARTFESSAIPAVRCDYFTVDYLDLDGRGVRFDADDRSFTVLMVVAGVAEVSVDSDSLVVTAGHTVLVPAVAGALKVKGNARLLRIRV